MRFFNQFPGLSRLIRDDGLKIILYGGDFGDEFFGCGDELLVISLSSVVQGSDAHFHLERDTF